MRITPILLLNKTGSENMEENFFVLEDDKKRYAGLF